MAANTSFEDQALATEELDILGRQFILKSEQPERRK
jgi:hypothetical protein